MAGKISIQKIDITKLNTDAIVNAANEGLWAGGGVCGAIFDAAGYGELTKACSAIGGCETGNAVITPGFRLPAKYIIHAVGPVWMGGGQNEPKLLYSAYKQSLILARENACHSIGFPLISTGIYGYPKDKAWRKAIQACLDFLKANPDYDMDIIFAVLEESIQDLGEKTLAELRAEDVGSTEVKPTFEKSVTTDYAKIYTFAKVQKVLYEHQEEVPGVYFGEIEYIARWLEELGFNMDCGVGMKEAFPEINVFNDVTSLRSVLDKVSIQLLGDTIYAKWRYFNHWSMGPMQDEDYEWFVVAYEGLAQLAMKAMQKQGS